MFRLGELVDGNWVAYHHEPLYERGERLMAGVPESDPKVFEALVTCMAPPYFLLYILHTSRGEAAEGRYQSSTLSADQVRSFLLRFRPFLSADARYDLWAHSPGEGATVVWDRHDQIYAYGPLDRFVGVLDAMGFRPGNPKVEVIHQHNYHAECDQMAKELVESFSWSYSPLRPEDEQAAV
ncbi:hypothetical protein [Cognatilysobacter lacus]|uniref:Uncharacterized protein n=1 Tax=Cognatilysobacter lacus TaxID=1643323 RepID=A0A5D8YXF0_9GAMM|nr:hypothetical protein [Lysobacter lacus]TZF85244.1 hypothetical protein FW784_12390 [Lysobacter lacus]